MAQTEVAIIIPAYNEAATIAGVVQSVSKFGNPIVVDDASTDGTYDLASSAGALVVRHTDNQGYDLAIQAGFAEAVKQGYPYAITFDADGQHTTQLLQEFINHLKNSNELVVGIRPDISRLSEKFFAWYTNLIFGVKDPLCGMKGYHLSLYCERGWFDSYGSIGTELTLYALKNKKQFAQILIPLKARQDQSRMGHAWKVNYRVFRALLLSFFKT